MVSCFTNCDRRNSGVADEPRDSYTDHLYGILFDIPCLTRCGSVVVGAVK